jgi:glucokinase
MDLSNDKRIVLTLDGGGTNFVFSAVQGNKEVIRPIAYPSNGHDLQKCLETILKGFREASKQLDAKPAAISFAFPGPTDYPNGIIGDLENLPAFKGGVALGPMLEEAFQIPVFINNDGDLFAYGEAISGFLPMVNQMLRKAGSTREYKNLIGITLGTGFGAGLVRNNELVLGDNGAAGEIWVVRSKLHPHSFSEECVSIRAVKRVYAEHCPDCAAHNLSPKDIFDIAMGQREGHKEAANEAFRQMGESIGEALASALTLFDGLVVIGGGLANAWPFFLPETIKELNSTIEKLDGRKVGRMEISAFNLEDETQTQKFIAGKVTKIKVPFSEKTVFYDSLKRTGIGITRLGTSKAVSMGAYAFALNEIDKNKASTLVSQE